MEACLQKRKEKKHRLKSEPSTKSKKKSASTDKNEEAILEEKLELKELTHSEVPEETDVKDLSAQENVYEKNCDSKREDSDKDFSPLSTTTIKSEISDSKVTHDVKHESTVVVPSSLVVNHGDQSAVKFSVTKQSILASEKHLLNQQYTLSKVKEPQNMYPDIKSMQFCEQMHGIVCSQTLVRTYTDDFRTKTAIQANEAYKNFIQVINELDKHPLYDMIHQYRKAKHSCIKLRSRLKYLNSDIKRKKDSLWKSVKKEVYAKGKCQDGSTVNISHSYIIKELDQDKFDEVVKYLKEIEESVSSDAFNFYLEELMKLKIEHYLYNLVKEDHIEDGIDNTKKAISILFDCLRQNAPDKDFAETCQKWLTTLVSKLLQSKKFDDNVFIINHVMRCPSGIENWATQFVHVPFDKCANEKNSKLGCVCCQKFLLVLFLVLNPVPLKDFFLKYLKDSASDTCDGNFIVLDSDGEEEEVCEMFKNWSEEDILSLLSQIPVRSLYKHLLLDDTDNSVTPVFNEEKILKMFAFSTVLIDILFTGMKTYCSDHFPKLFESISNLIRHILSYVTNYWAYHVNYNSNFKISIQAVYDRFFFSIIFQVYNILDTWMILSSLPYEYVSKKMLWNIIWIFFSPGRSEEEIYSEKDVERKVQDESVRIQFITYLKKVLPKYVIYLLNAFEKIALSRNTEEDFLKFLVHQICQITFVDTTLRDNLSKEGSVNLSSILLTYPYLLSVVLKEIDASNDAANFCISLFKTVNLSEWIPEDSDVSIISSWLLSNPLSDGKSCLARLILSNMNWEFTKEGQLFLPEALHNRIAILVTEAYLKFDCSCNEWLVSRGIKQILQFTAIINNQRNEEGFVHWAWNVLFSLKLHPLDRKFPPWIFIYDGCIDDCDKFVNDDINLKPLLTAFEKKHPAGCYLKIVMTDVGHNMKNLMGTGLDCLSFLVESEQYMVANRSLYYILPFFVKNPEQLLEDFRFIKSMNDLMTADMTYVSSLWGEPVIGAVIQNMADMMKHQIYQASKITVECAAPLLKLWIKILMKILHYDKSSKNKLTNSAKQIYFILDVLVKVSYLHIYTREYTLDLLSTYCNTLFLPSTNNTVWKRIFPPSPPVYAILDRNTVPEYPWLAWFVLSSEMKQKSVVSLWEKVQEEMVKKNDDTVSDCLKKVSHVLKIDQPPLECLPIYRWARQAVEVPASHPISPLLWQQFFLYFFQKVQLPNSQCYSSIGIKYFRYGSSTELMQRIKQYFSDAEKYYTVFLNSSASSAQRDESNKNINGSTFLSNIQKLFGAFQLWVNDESLHESKLCLSALEPKYCPSHLELILKGDQHVWFDMVSETSLKYELDQKIQSWYKKKTPNVVSKPSAENKESLPKQLTRHLENYEDPQTDLSDLPVSLSVHDMNHSTISSTGELVHLIEKNQSVIFNKAKYFSEQMKKMKQLNFNFINWVPQEYIVEDSEVRDQKVCHRGINGCSGAAHFKLKTQKYTKVERISEKIFRNREDFTILQDQLSKLSLKDLCDASLLIESYIRSLSSNMKAANSEEADRLRKMGVALFYHQIDAIDKTISSVVEYSPSRLFYSSIIESLGREFVDGHSTELQGLAKCILNHPEAGSLALPLFNPNRSCVQYFKLVYETLTLAIGKYSPSTLLALYSKLDFSVWLHESSPDFDSIKQIFKYVCNALLACGFSPCVEIFPVFEILKKHFKLILLYTFPELFHETVIFLLNGIENKNVCIDVYYEAFFCFGCSLFSANTAMDDIAEGLKKFAQNQQLPPNQQMFISVPGLNLMQVKHASETFHQHFMQKRLNCDLYKNYSVYIQPLGIFLAIISHSLVALQLGENSNQNQRDVSNLWEEFHTPFWPWLHPFENGLSFTFPWTNSEVDIARYMFQVFTTCVKYFHEQLLRCGSGESVLSYLWNDYVQIYVTPGLRHYSAAVCHSELLQLPWHEFHPSAHDIEGMCKILQSNSIESKQFLSKISLRIPWCIVMKNISLTKSPEYVGKVLATHGKLMIISQLNDEETEANLYPNIFKDLEHLSWHFLSVEDTEELLNLYYSSRDPLLFLNKLQSNSDVHILQFLKLVCCMVPNANREDYSNYKSILYVQKFISALSTCLSKKTFQLKAEDNFKTVLPILMSDIDNIICNGVTPDIQMNCALPLVKETVTFLNTLPEGELGLVSLNSIKSWINSNTQSPLLLPCLKVSSCYLNSVVNMVALSEGCISARFLNEVLDDPCETKKVWQLISAFFQVPSRLGDDFMKECVAQNAFLTLYCYMLHVIPKYNTLELRAKFLKKMVQWIGECKLSSQAEAKFLLLWDKILELSICLLIYDEIQIVKEELISFSCELEILAEDRSSSGFFGTIGFGQTSSLSVNFRFLCRVMAAYLQYQFPNQDYSPSSSAVKALENLNGLLKIKSYTALQSQVDYAVKSITSYKYNLAESRALLKYFAAILYPKESYLSSLNFCYWT